MHKQADEQLGAFAVSTYSRQDVTRILQISSRQLQGWERAGIIPHQQSYTFQDLGQLRTVRALREEAVPAASIRDSILAMKAVAGMANPLLEARVVRTGTRVAFRHRGATVDPIRRQLLFDFDGAAENAHPAVMSEPEPIRRRALDLELYERFNLAVHAEEAGDKQEAIELYEEILSIAPKYAAACINLGTLHFHLHQFGRAEEYYRRAAEADPGYVLAYFDLGNVLDEVGRLEESVAAYKQAIALSPRYADAHYNLALAYERLNRPRAALRHWQAYAKIDGDGPWSEHARGRIGAILSREKLMISWKSKRFVPRNQGKADLKLV
jgi:tetratricopeptide (TPR) repeat protein